MEFDRDLIRKKKKVKATVKTVDETEVFDYPYMLNRVFALMNRDGVKARRLKKPELPNISSQGRKTVWSNFKVICKEFNRPLDHVMSFICAETSSECNLDSKESLIIKGKYTRQNIQDLIIQYIKQYVVCSLCKNSDTSLIKDPAIRITYLLCSSCKSKKSVLPIKSGYRHQKKV